MREKRKRKWMKFIFACVMVCSLAVIVPGLSMTTQAATYKNTKYKSFADVKKQYSKDDTQMFGNCFASKKLKTKYGVKNVLMVSSYGTTCDCKSTCIYMKKGKKIFRIANVEGMVTSVSKDRKYFFANGGGTFCSVYKYKGGKYKRVKYLISADSTYFDKKEKLRKKYKLDVDNVQYR